MRINFKVLSISNFMSYGKKPTIIEFDKVGTTLILGEDLDNTSDGKTSNGSGKTSIMNALTYALYDKAISSDIKVNDLINNINGKQLEVIVEFEKNGNVYRVERRRKFGKGDRENTVHFFENGIQKARGSVNNTDKAIVDVLGMSYDMFVRIVVISASHQPFLDMPVTSHYQANQTDFIERLFNLTLLTDQANLLKKQIKLVEEAISIQKTKIESFESEIKRYSELKQSTHNRITNWTTQTTKQIIKLKSQLESVNGIDLQKEQVIHKQINEVGQQIKDLEQAQQQLKQIIRKYEKNIEKNTHDLKHLQDQKCPYCKQYYEGSEDQISACKSNIETGSVKLKEYEAEHVLINTDKKEAEHVLQKLKKTQKVTDIDGLLELHSQQQSISQQILDLENSENPFLGTLDDLINNPPKPVDYSDINELSKLLDHQQFLLKLLTKKDSFIRKALLNKNLPFLNNRLNGYIGQLGLSHKVEFTHEMTASISLFGRTLSFGNLSSGQKARVNLALTLSFRDVLQKIHTPINICLLDEILDVGLDSVGVQIAARMIKHKARDEELDIFVISHREEVGNVFDRTILVQMNKGFSSIVPITSDE